jgi:hypothetical protein
MRSLLLLGWLLLPVGFAIWHYGPGQDRVKLDQAAKFLSAADQAAQEGEFANAVELYENALALLPPGYEKQGQRIRLEKAKAQMHAKQLPTAHTDLKVLVDELQNENGDPKLLAESRSALAQSQYYMTWLMRLEGLSRDEWEPEIEAARQNYRLLAEKGDAKAKEDLESAIRLARMDLSELQGLPLPSQ